MTKKKRNPSKSTSKYKKYKIENGKVTPGRICPKCGPGIFMAEHKNRYHCGRCGYAEFKK
jgi:small subunit ribosomal protein S27Ae